MSLIILTVVVLLRFVVGQFEVPFFYCIPPDTSNNVVSKIQVANCGDSPCKLYRGHFSKIWVDIDPNYNSSLGTVYLTAVELRTMKRYVIFDSDTWCYNKVLSHCEFKGNGSYNTWSHLIPVFPDSAP
ncbi:unnamed protein product, partial [Dicrocoelium dendriticum]